MDSKELHEIATLNAMVNNDKWSSWGSPIGLMIFFNGLALCGILVRYIFLMK